MMNLCRACRQDFGSVSAFDNHRTGKHGYPWSPEHEDGRRCLETGELEAKGWRQDKQGRWRTPSQAARPLPLIFSDPPQKPQKRFAASRRAAETGRVTHG
jgi:hypothetical protein